MFWENSDGFYKVTRSNSTLHAVPFQVDLAIIDNLQNLISYEELM